MGIDDLPDVILQCILSALTIKDAVRSSLLSRRWRPLFLSSVHTLDFSSCLSPRLVPTEEDINFLDFVDRFFSNPDMLSLEILNVVVLSRRWRPLFLSSVHTLDFSSCLSPRLVPTEEDINFLDFVDRFFSNPDMLSLEILNVVDHWVRKDVILQGEDFLRLNRWICAALSSGVKEIAINFMFSDFSTLPSLLFTSQTLVVLKLEVNFEVNVPSKISLPNLKTLHLLRSVFQDGSSVLGLISSCPRLENLESVRCVFQNISELNINSFSLRRLLLNVSQLTADSQRVFNVIKINAPKLVCFEYYDPRFEECTCEMKSLERATIDINLPSNIDRENAANLLRGIRNVHSLFLCIEDVSRTLFLAPLDPMLAFNNLVELQFHNHYIHDWQGDWIVEFMHCMPILNTLILGLSRAEAGVFVSLTTTIPSCLLFHLKEVEIIYFEGEERMLELISYFLKHALILEKLIIRRRPNVRKEELLNIIDQLSNLPKESKKCKIMAS